MRMHPIDADPSTPVATTEAQPVRAIEIITDERQDTGEAVSVFD